MPSNFVARRSSDTEDETPQRSARSGSRSRTRKSGGGFLGLGNKRKSKFQRILEQIWTYGMTVLLLPVSLASLGGGVMVQAVHEKNANIYKMFVYTFLPVVLYASLIVTEMFGYVSDPVMGAILAVYATMLVSGVVCQTIELVKPELLPSAS